MIVKANESWTRGRVCYTVGLRIRPEAARELEELAYTRRMNVSEFAGRLIEDGLARLKQQQSAGVDIYGGLEAWLTAKRDEIPEKVDPILRYVVDHLLDEVREAGAQGALPWQERAK